MFFSKATLVVVVSAVALSVLATPHALNHAVHHRAIAARVASPQNVTTTFRKRQNTQRCKQRSIPSSSSSLPKPSPSPSTHLQPPHATTQQPVTPVTTSKPAPSPTPVQQPIPTTTAPQSSGNNGNQPSFLIGTQTGEGTFYDTGLGACGITNTDTDHIAAVSHLMFDVFPGYNHVNPNSNPICGKKIKATYNDKSVIVTVTDRCTGCALSDLDFSPSAFSALAAFEVGRIQGMEWVWI